MAAHPAGGLVTTVTASVGAAGGGTMRGAAAGGATWSSASYTSRPSLLRSACGELSVHVPVTTT